MRPHAESRVQCHPTSWPDETVQRVTPPHPRVPPQTSSFQQQREVPKNRSRLGRPRSKNRSRRGRPLAAPRSRWVPLRRLMPLRPLKSGEPTGPPHPRALAKLLRQEPPSCPWLISPWLQNKPQANGKCSLGQSVFAKRARTTNARDSVHRLLKRCAEPPGRLSASPF